MKKEMNQRTISLGLAAILFAASSVFAQTTDVGLRMEVDKRQVQVGESLTLSIEFKQIGAGNVVGMQEPQISTPEHFEIRGSISSTEVHIINNQTAQISTTKLTLIATKPGTEVLGPALLIYQDAQMQKREIKSNVASVTVIEKEGLFTPKKKRAEPPPASPSPAAPSTDDLKDIKPLMPESNPFLKILFWLVIAALVGGFLWRQLRKPSGGKSVPPPLGRVQQLRENWKRLGKEELSSKEFCLGLSGLVRECLEYRYGFSAVDYTTGEVLKELDQRNVTGDEMSAVEKCLKTCDRVLYADGNLTGRDALRSLASPLLPKVNKS